ncbi:MAG: hypothetical protein LQ340_001591, partial [Diploschistes diacapsis]
MAKAKESKKGQPTTQAIKAKGRDVAKTVAKGANRAGGKAKKIVKEPTPDSSDDSEAADGAETSDSSDSSESETVAKPSTKANGSAKANGKVNGAAHGSAKAIAMDDSGDESDDEPEGDSDESDEEIAPAVTGANPKKAESDDSEDDSEEDDDSEKDDEVDEEKSIPQGPVDAQALHGALTKISSKEQSEASGSDDDSGSDESDSGSDESSEEEEAKKEVPQKKRKAEADVAPVAKKPKSDAAATTATSKILFVGNLSWNVDEEWLRREFEGFGDIESVRLMIDRDTSKPKGFGFVEFADIASAQEAHDSMKDVEIDGRRPNVDYSLPRKQNDGPQREQRAKNFGDETSPPSATLFVGNIPFQATEDMVGQIFGDHGSVISVRLPTKPENGEPKGFGYVEFASVEDATTAFEAMKGQSIEGRSIRLDYSQP